MKLGDIIVILSIVLLFGMLVGVSIGYVQEAQEHRKECEAKGGVFVNTKHSYLCLKKELVVE